MGRGARFYKCDFQVHSPRDINWGGHRPTSEEERKQYASGFIAACRKLGLNAVAITDHHDIGFYKYIKEAAKNETNEAGIAVAPDNQIVVFPGMELTLGVPCQALLILDADFPISLLSSIPTCLSITPNDAAAAQHAQVVRLEHFKSIEKLCEQLDTIDYLRGHYIVLPNVSDSGDFSILRKGFASHYKSMPCVGGYVDGFVGKLGQGNRNILKGEAKEYGFKRLAVFQTSDNRHANFSSLGKASSWVKWAIPTAEAIRQACLAQETRIHNEEPQIPALIIQSIQVSNSKFLGPIDLDFNPQLNCLIGGRGTGKSTVLEYIRWALCDQPADSLDETELPDVQRKRQGLIGNTLVPLDATVAITFVLNGITHSVRRYSATGQLSLKVGSGDYQDCYEDTIRNLLPIQAYSQKQLSTVGVRMEELDRFVKTPIKQNLRDFELRQDQWKATLRSSYQRLQVKRVMTLEIEKDRTEVASLVQQVHQLRTQLTGLGDSDQAILIQHEGYLQEGRLVNEVERALVSWREMVETNSRKVALPQVLTQLVDGTPSKDLVEKIRVELSALHQIIIEKFSDIEKSLVSYGGTQSKLREYELRILENIKRHTEQYEAAKSRSSAHESRLDQIAKAEQRLAVIRQSMADNEARVEQLGEPEKEYSSAREQWLAQYRERGDALESRCNDLTTLSKGVIRARLRRGAGVRLIHQHLNEIITGTRIRSNKVEALCELIANDSSPIEKWSAALREFEQLCLLGEVENSTITIPTCTVLTEAGFSSADLEKLAKQMSLVNWLELSVAELEDLPLFEYKQGDNEYIEFADASAGQQATALLRVLLNQEGPPLLIDQPEEDLDNPVILEIVKDIWSAKAKRQLIFSSHNANIVVNGDADLVVCCDYRKAADQSGGVIKLRGAIDMDEIRTEITQVMEGGKEAFRLRKEKYGF